jgi:hypothetical protein
MPFGTADGWRLPPNLLLARRLIIGALFFRAYFTSLFLCDGGFFGRVRQGFFSS